MLVELHLVGPIVDVLVLDNVRHVHHVRRVEAMEGLAWAYPALAFASAFHPFAWGRPSALAFASFPLAATFHRTEASSSPGASLVGVGSCACSSCVLPLATTM